MIKSIQRIWQEHTFLSIMILALILRLVAAIFSKGYAMSDDHFVVIHVAQRWLDGFNDWFNMDHPSGFSLVYTGAHYILFYLLKSVGITDPVTKMYFVRIIHAVYSMLTVYFGYKIALKLTNKNIAAWAGLLLATFWLIPFMSVRNLNEMVCVPPIMAGFYLVVNGIILPKKNLWIVAGMMFGLAFAIRYQTILIPGGIGLVLMVQQQWRQFAQFTLGTLLGMFLLQGIVDWIFWDYPFAAFVQYTFYNIQARNDYVIGPWYNYILLMIGVLIPPVSFGLLFGYFRTIKKYAIIFWPILLFLIFHSLFPNKQERFILPVLAPLLILATIGWNGFISTSHYWQKHNFLRKAMHTWFWSINIILLFILTVSFTKKSLVEPMIYFSENPHVKAVIIEYDRANMPWFPRFYMEEKKPIYRLSKDYDKQEFVQEINESDNVYPNYVFFFGSQNLEQRKSSLEELLNITLLPDKRIDPGFLDAILHRLNPKHNLNLTSYIFKIRPKNLN